jgi:hypothetical protein
MGIASLIVGFLALLLFWFPFVGFLLAVIGTTLAAIGLGMRSAQRKAGKAVSEALPIAGLVLSLVALVPSVLMLLMLLMIGAAAGDPGAAQPGPIDTGTRF